MENIDQIIKENVQPYLIIINSLKGKLKEKEADIVTLKYAVLEMDRKFQELEKKVKATTARTGTAAAGRTTTSSRVGSSRPTMRSGT